MIIPKPFYRGNPPDGTIATGDVTHVTVFDLGAQVPGYKKWRIEELVISNMTQVDGYYSVAIFPGWVNVGTFQPNMGAMDGASPLPRSTNPGTLDASTSDPTDVVNIGYFLAYSQLIPPVTTFTMPIVAWALGGEKLWAGVYPGAWPFVGLGGVSLGINGREYRD